MKSANFELCDQLLITRSLYPCDQLTRFVYPFLVFAVMKLTLILILHQCPQTFLAGGFNLLP